MLKNVNKVSRCHLAQNGGMFLYCKTTAHASLSPLKDVCTLTSHYQKSRQMTLVQHNLWNEYQDSN